MKRILRWGMGLVVISSIAITGLVFLPFASWLPGGTVDDVPISEVVNGTAFNRLFPAAEAGEQVLFAQEKRGFSEARLKKQGETTALLAISDVITAPQARDKYTTSVERLGGWPLVEQGAEASAVLVADRFQVKVISQGPGLSVAQRHDLIQAFDLEGLARLAPSFDEQTERPMAAAPATHEFDPIA